jgi:hypothetical protein
MAFNAQHARSYPNIQQLLKDELAANEELQSLSESEQQESLDGLAVLWKASEILTDAWHLTYDYLVSHGYSETDAGELMTQFKEELD